MGLRIRKLRSAALALVALNFLQLPSLAAMVSPVATPRRSNVLTPCACSEETPCTLKHKAADSSPLPTGTPSCAGIDFSNCVRDDNRYVSFCLREGVNPLSCVLWKHQLTVWFCPGQTWYKCAGSWFSTGVACTPCSIETPSSLPPGCPNPNPGWKLCV